MKIYCKHCGRYLLDAKGTTIVEGLICPNSKCKAKLNIKIVDHQSSEQDLKYKFTTEETQPKKKI